MSKSDANASREREDEGPEQNSVLSFAKLQAFLIQFWMAFRINNHLNRSKNGWLTFS